MSAGFTTLRGVVGQARAVAQIERAIASGKIAQAYLFDGPHGAGKRTAAVGLAAALNCEVDPLGCGACGSCDKVARDLHPDVLLVAADGAQIKIEQVRAVTARLAYTPHEGKVRVIVIDEAERLNPNAANALLKSLEEPRPHTRFVLVSSASHRLLPTVRSRCQRVRFAPLEQDVLCGLLRSLGIDEKAAREAALLCDGSPGRALALLQGGHLAERREVAAALERAAEATSAREAFHAAARAGTDREEIAQALALVYASLGARMRERAGRGDSTRSLRGAMRAVRDATEALAANASAALTLEKLVWRFRGA
jgi:DNA polymerase-3 subunit delta'